MTDLHRRYRHYQASTPPRIAGKSAALASLAALCTGIPLLGMSGFIFLASFVLLFVASLPLLLFSPVLLGVAAALAATLAAYAAAATMALSAVAAFRLASKELRVARRRKDFG